MSKKAIARINQMSREEWLALRMHGLGGSDAAAACGMSKWKSPLMLWLEKTGKQASQAAGEAAYWGTIMEPILRNEFAKRTGLKVEEVPFMFQNQEHPFMLADVDGIVREADGSVSLLEIKTAGSYAAAEWADGLPAEYYLQIQHYLAVLELPKAYVAMLLGGNQFSYHEISRDDAVIKNIISLEAAFWQQVETGKEPPVDDSESTADALAIMYPKGNKTSLILPDEADAVVSYYLEVKSAEAQAKKEKILCENKLKAMMQDAECAKTPTGISISWKSMSTSRLDTTALKAAKPEIVNKYTVTATSRRFTVSTKKSK